MGKLVAYGGFSSSNYLEQPYNADLDFGTGDFCVMGWVNISDTTNNKVWFTRSNPVTLSSNRIICKVYNGLAEIQLASTAFTSTSTVGNGVWNHVVFTRRSGAVQCFVNGILESTATYTIDLTDTSAKASIGVLNYNKTLNFSGGSLALIRISATAPSASQVAKIYEDEKVLFQENAQATLYGSSDAVTALAYDDSTNILSVGTSAGRSDFQGLRRVNNTTNAVGAAISASNGMIVEE